jgi:hypothetical protein
MPLRSRFRRPRQSRPNSPYSLIFRGSDNRLLLERFVDANAYRAQLTVLRPSIGCSVTIDEVADWLDSDHEPAAERKDRRSSPRRVSST